MYHCGLYFYQDWSREIARYGFGFAVSVIFLFFYVLHKWLVQECIHLSAAGCLAKYLLHHASYPYCARYFNRTASADDT